MMKRILMSTALSATLALTGCIAGGGTESEGENSLTGLTIVVQDSTGAAFAADTVYWSYKADGVAAHKSAHGTDTTMKGAARLNAQGTRWAIEYAGLHGAVYIRGRSSRPDSANPAHCAWTAYTYLVGSAAMLPATDTLVLKPKKVCL